MVSPLTAKDLEKLSFCMNDMTEMACVYLCNINEYKTCSNVS